MNKLLTLFALLISLACHGQTVRIDFTPGSSDDFDLFISKGLNNIGYNTFVNYFGTKDHLPYDILVKYQESNEGLIIEMKNINSNLTKRYWNKINKRNKLKTVSNILTELTNKKVKIEQYHSASKDPLGYETELLKLDSAVYILKVVSQNSYNKQELIQNFYRKASLLASNYSAYYSTNTESSSYSYYNPPFGYGTSTKIIHTIKGIIIGHSENQNILLEEPPLMYAQYFDYIPKSEESSASEEKVAENATSRICFIRDTGFTSYMIRYKVFLDNNLICKLANDSFSFHEVSPGTYNIAVQRFSSSLSDHTERLKVKVKPGSTVYVKIIQEVNMVVILHYFEINASEADRILIKMIENETCN